MVDKLEEFWPIPKERDIKMHYFLLSLLLALSLFADAALAKDVAVTPNPDWVGDTTVKAACVVDSGPVVVLAVLPAIITIPTPPQNGNAVTKVVGCFAFRGTDPNAPTIRSVGVSDTQNFPAVLGPPGVSH